MADDDHRRPRGPSPPSQVMHGALRYIRSQAHLLRLERKGARGGRDDVGPFENELWRGRADRMRQMHEGSAANATVAKRPPEEPPASAAPEVEAPR